VKIEIMRRPKLTVRPTPEELELLHERAGMLGYDSLSAYLVECGLRDGGVLPREHRTLESLLLHVRLLSATVEDERRRRGAGVLDQVSQSTLWDITGRASEALRLINIILGRATSEREREAA
jgi:hypothetical protein